MRYCTVVAVLYSLLARLRLAHFPLFVEEAVSGQASKPNKKERKRLLVSDKLEQGRGEVWDDISLTSA